MSNDVNYIFDSKILSGICAGSSNGHSPVLNLSKTAGSGSVGEQSGSEAGASHRSQDDEEEDDNLSEDLEDDNEKDEGACFLHFNRVRQERSALPGIYISDKAVGSKETVRPAIN